MSTAVLASDKYTFGNYRTYLAAAAFVCGNILVPQLCHLIPNGGLIFLPIYFFTLVRLESRPAHGRPVACG